MNTTLDQLISFMSNHRLGITNNITKSPFELNDDRYHCSAIIREKKRSCSQMVYSVISNYIKQRVICVISIGQNKYKINTFNKSQKKATIHAEEDAIYKLPPLKRSKRLEDVNLVVIRTSRTGVLSNSAPCIHCLKMMKENAEYKGYKINNIYFSNKDGNIECHRLINLIYSNDLHISSYYKLNNYNMDKWLKWRKNI